MSRPQVVALALLTCVPIPLLSLAATVVPLPEMLERAAATFVPFVPPTLGDDEGRVARESASAVRTLGIVHRPSEQSASSLAPRAVARAHGGGRRRGATEAQDVLEPSLAPEGNPAAQPGNWTPDSTPTGGAGEQGESPPSGTDPTTPVAGEPSGDAPIAGDTGGSPAPSGSGGTTSGDAPGQTSGHGKAGSPPGQGDSGPPSDNGGGNSGGSGNGSGQGTPPSEPPGGGGTPPGAGGPRR